ncbi:MAG: peptidase S10 [Betaproteobacteria bacterium]|nr:peptidase S10 [Betaproteobacteria bacterium]
MNHIQLRSWRAGVLAAALALAACGGGGGGGDGGGVTTPPPAATFTDPNTYSSAASASLSTPNENVSVTQHTITLNGVALSYTATAGHLTARTLGAAAGAAQASFFYVAYTLNGRDPATRPITFFYNGGPGSASVWLHLGSFGPKRLVTGIPATTAAAPFPLVDNTDSLLDVSDLVFVDAVGSGYSMAIAPNTNQSFWGVDADATVFRDFVMRYTAAFNRGTSPKFLYGESYGGPRAALMAMLLESAGTRLAGVVLQSPAMDYNANCGVVATPNISCAPYLPSYAASGAWHNVATPSPAPAGIPAHMVEMRQLATTQYQPAVQAFLAGSTPSLPLVNQLVSATGLSQASWLARFNMTAPFFRTNLVNGQLLGRYDARVIATSTSALASEGDPSQTFINSSFAAGIGNHLTNTLRFTTPSAYVMSSGAINTWNFSHNGRPVPDTIPDLAAAIALNPRLKVLAVGGYHDLATPFFITEQDLARLGNSPNVQVKTYMGGHMTFLDDGSRVAQRADLVQFYQSALAQ